VFLCRAPKELTENIDLLLRKLLSPWLLANRGDTRPSGNTFFYMPMSLTTRFFGSLISFNLSTDYLFFLKLKVMIEFELLMLVLLLLDLSNDLSLR